MKAADIRLAEPGLWEDSTTRDGVFAVLRRDAPVSWQPEPETEWFSEGRGFWAVVRHSDVSFVSRDSATFISGQGTEIFDLSLEMARIFGSFLNMDGLEHRVLRRIVAKAFTPQMVAELGASIRTQMRKIVRRVRSMGEFDFVAEVAVLLPSSVICDMGAVPVADRAEMARLTDIIASFGSSHGSLDSAYSGVCDLIDYAASLVSERRARPGDDFLSLAATAEVDGERLDDHEVGSLFALLIAAGIETTATALSHATLALQEHQGERLRWKSNFNGLAETAIEEILRWSTPLLNFRRTATRDVELGDRVISAGDKVVLWYISANRDESVFKNPAHFDLARHPNDHVTFGGGGRHFCLGANLARLELRIAFEEIFTSVAQLEVVGDPVFATSMFTNGIRELPCRVVD